MTDFLDYADNLILHLERDNRSIKCFTTEDNNKFKILNGLSHLDSITNKYYITLKELKQLLVDSVVNGYTLKLNLVFKQGINGIVNELANEYKKREKNTCDI
jgi:hypothetical protein